MWRIDSGESLIDRSALLQPELGADLGIWRLSVLGTGWLHLEGERCVSRASAPPGTGATTFPLHRQRGQRSSVDAAAPYADGDGPWAVGNWKSQAGWQWLRT
jgi:hypothetical protein